MAGIFTGLQSVVDQSLSKISSPEITLTVNSISQIFGSIMLLWITFKSIDIAFGRQEFIISENLHKILMISIITTIAFDASGWIKTILSIVQEFRELILPPNGAIAHLDALTDEFNEVTEPVIKKAPWGSGWAISFCFWISFFLMVGSCLFLLLGAEVTFAITLLFTPLAILSLTFEYTKNIFDGWLSSIMGSLITMLLSTLVLSLIGHIIKTIVQYLSEWPTTAAYVSAGSTLFFAFFFYYLMNDVKNLAKTLTGFSCGCVTNLMPKLKMK